MYGSFHDKKGKISLISSLVGIAIYNGKPKALITILQNKNVTF